MALGLRTNRADLLPLGDDLLWAAVCEPWCSQPALEGPAVRGGGQARTLRPVGAPVPSPQPSLALWSDSEDSCPVLTAGRVLPCHPLV